jgi:hypothetical protein
MTKFNLNLSSFYIYLFDFTKKQQEVNFNRFVNKCVLFVTWRYSKERLYDALQSASSCSHYLNTEKTEFLKSGISYSVLGLTGCWQMSRKSNKLFNSMNKGPYREVDNRSANQQIPHLSCNHKIHYSAHKSQLLDPLLLQMNISPYFSIHFNNISYLCLGFPGGQVSY